jgi:hypothetical protein
MDQSNGTVPADHIIEMLNPPGINSLHHGGFGHLFPGLASYSVWTYRP